MPRKPKKGETKKDYMNYCMGADVMLKEYPDQKQRAAVCNSYWTSKKKSKSGERIYIDVIAKAYDLSYIEGEVKDTIVVKFKLCHSNRNANGDEFTINELSKVFQTAETKAITYGHNKTYAIGHISKAVFIDTVENKAYSCFGSEDDLTAYGYIKGEDSYIYCEGIIWKNRFPDETEEIRTDFENAELFFSMEAYFTKCMCSACKCVFEAADDYCDHLEGRYDNGVSRILMDCTFTGVAKVTHPADRGAIGLSAAKEGFSLAELIPDDKFDSNVLRVFTELMLEDEID